MTTSLSELLAEREELNKEYALWQERNNRVLARLHSLLVEEIDNLKLFDYTWKYCVNSIGNAYLELQSVFIHDTIHGIFEKFKFFDKSITIDDKYIYLSKPNSVCMNSAFGTTLNDLIHKYKIELNLLYFDDKINKLLRERKKLES
jgi:hypothetical protein